MKIIVDREDLQSIKDTLDNCKYDMVPSKGMSNAVFDVRKIVSKLLDTGISIKDREWADKHIMLKDFFIFINKVKQIHPKIAGARVNCVNNRNMFNPATRYASSYIELEECVKGFIAGTIDFGGEVKNISIEIITEYAEKELSLKLKG